MGGPDSSFRIGAHTSSFEKSNNLKDEFLTVTSHGQTLRYISTKFAGNAREHILGISSIVDLRAVCLPRAFSSDDTDYIVQKAVNPKRLRQELVIQTAAAEKHGRLVQERETTDELC